MFNVFNIGTVSKNTSIGNPNASFLIFMYVFSFVSTKRNMSTIRYMDSLFMMPSWFMIFATFGWLEVYGNLIEEDCSFYDTITHPGTGGKGIFLNVTLLNKFSSILSPLIVRRPPSVRVACWYVTKH